MISALELIWGVKLTDHERAAFMKPTKIIEGIGPLTHGNYCGPGNNDLPPIDSLDQACMFHDYFYGGEYADEKFIMTLKLLAMNGLIANRFLHNLTTSWSSCLRLILKMRRFFPGEKINSSMRRF
jgi:hypothetical protein